MSSEDLLNNIKVVFNDLLNDYIVVKNKSNIALFCEEREFFIRFRTGEDDTLTIGCGLIFSEMLGEIKSSELCFDAPCEEIFFKEKNEISTILKARHEIEKKHKDQLYGIFLSERLEKIGVNRNLIIENDYQTPGYQSSIILFNKYAIELKKNYWFQDYYLFSSVGIFNNKIKKIEKSVSLNEILEKIFKDFDKNKTALPDQESVDYLIFYISKFFVYLATKNIDLFFDDNY